ncbi:hypothetical protein GW17_00015931 [Ensete ventricosum]|nr:hypothetical protein GW17_00015931 [Ensete ventricosum]
MPNAAHSSFTHFSNNRQTAALLNTSTASVTSKPSTPGHRSNSRMTPFTPSRSSPSRSSQNSSRPSSPTVRPQIGSIASSTGSTAAAATRSNSRPSTPTRRASAAAVVASANIRSTSPAPRGRAQAQTKPPERATSTGRQRRPGTASTQSSSPLVTRGRLQENTSNARSNHKVITASESPARRAMKPALKNTTDIKQSMGGIRGTSPFPRIARSADQKGRPGRSSELGVSTCRGVAHHVDAGVSDDDSRNGDISNGCNGSVVGNEDIAVSLKSA